MKKKVLILTSILMISSVMFGTSAKKGNAKAKGGTSLEQSLNNLESQLERLTQLENQKFREQEMKANEAQARLNKYVAMEESISQRIADIENNADTRIFGKEFKDKIAEYKKIQSNLQKEIAKEQKVVDDFELLKSLR